MPMAFQVMLAVLAMAALQDVHASRLKVSALIDDSFELDQQHVTQLESNTAPGISADDDSAGDDTRDDSYEAQDSDKEVGEATDCETDIVTRIEELMDRIVAYYGKQCQLDDEKHIVWDGKVATVTKEGKDLLCEKPCQNQEVFAKDAPDSSELTEACPDHELTLRTIRVHDAFDAARKACQKEGIKEPPPGSHGASTSEDELREQQEAEETGTTTTTTMEATTMTDATMTTAVVTTTTTNITGNDTRDDSDEEGIKEPPPGGHGASTSEDELREQQEVEETGSRLPELGKMETHLVKCHRRTFWLRAGIAYGLLGGIGLAALFGFLCFPLRHPPDPASGVIGENSSPGRDPQDSPQWGVTLEILANASQRRSIPEAVPLWTCRRILAVVIPVVISPWFGGLVGYHMGSQQERVVLFSCELGTHPPSPGSDCSSELITSKKCITTLEFCPRINPKIWSPTVDTNPPVDAAALSKTRKVSCTGGLLGNIVTCGPDRKFTPIPECAWGCTTGTGTACTSCVRKSSRTISDHCATCNDGYRVVNTSCQAWDCTTGVGTGCGSCVGQSSRTNDAHCATCNNGYRVVGTSCQAWNCTTGSDNACTSCVVQSSRTIDDHCAACNNGYHVVNTYCQANTCVCPNGVPRNVPDCTVDQATECASCNPGYHGDTCEAWGCTTGAGTGCVSCVEQSSRTNGAHCAACNDGHHLVGTSCQAFGCTTGSDTACLTCVSQAFRIIDDHCHTCNNGYHLVDKSCKAWGCTTRDGNGCKTCVSQISRTIDDHCATCNDGYFVNGTSCQANTCVCPNGVPRNVPDCTVDQATECASCNPGYHGDTCEACPSGYSAPCPSGYYKLSNTCCQAWGCITAAKGTGCATCVAQALRNGDTNCATCNHGHHEQDGTCQAIGCPFPCETCPPQEERSTEVVVCRTCRNGYQLLGGTCKAWGCITGGGTACKNCVPQKSRTTGAHCANCNDGYHVVDSSCQAFRCTTGSYTACFTCVSQASRTIDNHCATCNNGYYRVRHAVGASCQAWDCTTGLGTACKSCVGQSSRTSDKDCATCNDGYGVVGTSCEAWTCITGGGAACKSCVGLSSRTIDDHCASCNDGHHVVGKTCKAWGCTTGTGTGCSSCVRQSDRRNDAHCASCINGYYIVGGSCQAWGCTIGPDTGCKSCVGQSDRRNGAHCASCNDGYYVVGEVCQAWGCTTGKGIACKSCVGQSDRRDDAHCATCNDGYGVVGTFCQVWGCTTGTGAGCDSCVRQSDRRNGAHCASCNEGYHVVGESCQAWGCTTGSGTACKFCVLESIRTSDDHCAACNKGHRLVGTACKAWGCTTGPDTGCKSCVSQSDRKNDVHCATCNNGYRVEGRFCEAWGCTTGTGNACKSCAEQSSRIINDHCASCNKGYGLVGTHCQVLGCTTGADAGCKSCVRQPFRTTGAHCATCNDGYIVAGTTCQAWECVTGSGTACKSCVGQSSRTAEDHCATCNDGHILVDTACQAYGCLTGKDTGCKTCVTQTLRKDSETCADCNKDHVLIEGKCPKAAELTKFVQEQREKAAEESKEKAAHPACDREPTCRCAGFYDWLIKQCMDQWEDSAQEKEKRQTECDSKIRFLWANKLPEGANSSIEKEWRRWSYDFFLKPFGEVQSDEEEEEEEQDDTPKALQGVFASFWAGYSWTLGTRQVFDHLMGSKLKPGAFDTTDQVVFHLEDIEHRTHRIGAVMRHLKWDRGCHQSGHDSKLWLSLSKAYAEGTSQEAQSFLENQKKHWFKKGLDTINPFASTISAPPVVVFINYRIDKLEGTFLFLHEFELMAAFSKIVLVDYKNECKDRLVHDVEKAAPKKFKDKIVCLKGDDQKDMGRLFVDTEKAVQLAQDIKLLEADKAVGIAWKTVGKAPLVKATKSILLASFEECQKQCKEWSSCKFFTHYPQRKRDPQCVMFHRDVDLNYKRVDRKTAVSGRKQKEESFKVGDPVDIQIQIQGNGRWVTNGAIVELLKKASTTKEGKPLPVGCAKIVYNYAGRRGAALLLPEQLNDRSVVKRPIRPATLEGFLKKEPERGLIWNKRYVELKNGWLIWWETLEAAEDGEKPHKSLELVNMQVELKAPQSTVFFIRAPTGVLKFDAGTEAENPSAARWVVNLKNHIAYANRKHAASVEAKR